MVRQPSVAVNQIRDPLRLSYCDIQSRSIVNITEKNSGDTRISVQTQAGLTFGVTVHREEAVRVIEVIR